MFHQARCPWNKGISLSQLPFVVRSCEVAIIWSDSWKYKYKPSFEGAPFVTWNHLLELQHHPVWSWINWKHPKKPLGFQVDYLVGGWTNPIWKKYAKVKLDNFPQGSGWKSKIFETTHLLLWPVFLPVKTGDGILRKVYLDRIVGGIILGNPVKTIIPRVVT